MIAAVFRGPGELEVAEVATPKIGPDEVLVKIGANTVCGTDVRILRGEKSKGIDRDTVLGHEPAGRVAEVGRNVRGYEVGQPVALYPEIVCRRCYFCQRGLENMCTNARIFGYVLDGGLGEYVRIPADAIEAGNLFAAERDLPPERLALAEPLGCCVNGHRRSGTKLDDTVLVMGAGPIGLFHLQLSLLAGARTVIVTELSEARRKTAQEFGAHVVVDPANEDLAGSVAEHTDGLGVDVAVICIGVPALVNDALRLTRKGGNVNIFAGLAKEGWAEIEANLVHYNELTLTGTSNSTREEYGMALKLIESGRVTTETMVTHRFPLAQAVEAIDRSASGEGIKVAVMP